MLHIRKTRHKLKPYVRFFLFCIVIMCITVIIGMCFLWFSLSHRTVLSPLGKAVFLKNPASTEERVAQDLQEKNIQYIGMKSSNATITIFLPDDIQVVIATKKDISSQIASLQLIMANLTIEKKKPVKIDFRFDRPVISF